MTYTLMILVFGAFISWWIADEPLPVGETGEPAEALTDSIWIASQMDQWDDIAVIGWSFRGAHHYVWDKRKHFVRATWDDYIVVFNKETVTGHAWKAGFPLLGEAAEKAVNRAHANWINDSFWLNPLAKMRDPGTIRSVVKLDDGRRGLLVQYSSGGLTPGDAYLWLIDPTTGLPNAWKMWVSISPVGGMEFSWEEWDQVPEGCWISHLHAGALFDINITNVVTGSNLGDFGLEQDVFDGL